MDPTGEYLAGCIDCTEYATGTRLSELASSLASLTHVQCLYLINRVRYEIDPTVFGAFWPKWITTLKVLSLFRVGVEHRSIEFNFPSR